MVNIALEFLCEGLDAWASWRFYLPFLISLALIGLIMNYVSASGAAICLAIPVFVAGVTVGVCWQCRKDRAPPE